MTDVPDFLWATSDVAIWSSCETGIGIMASSSATLRPLFRAILPKFFDSEGESSSQRPWTTTGSKAGYLRSTNDGVNNNIMLRGDLPSSQGITTVIDADGRRTESAKGLKTEESEMVDDSSSEEYARPHDAWGVHGIRKTVVHTQETA